MIASSIRPAVLAAAALGMIATSVGARAQTVATADPAELSEIVVTATRRAESIDRVPISISAFSQETLDTKGVKNVDELARFTPGLTFAASGDGLTNSIAIRGVASGVGASTTGIYIDDTPIQVRSGTGAVTENAYPQLFDLQRVEVLRGPQGTLFGTGSMGGTVRFITPEPDLHQYSGYTRAELSSTRHGDPSYETGVAVGGPIVDGSVGFRLSAFYINNGGYIDLQPFTGNAVTDKDINYDHTTVLRGALKFAVSDSLTISPSFLYQKKNRNDSFFWSDLSDVSDSRLRDGFTDLQPVSDKFALPALRIEWRPDHMQLISNTSFLYRELHRNQDYSNFEWWALTGISPTPSEPVPDYRSNSLFAVRQNSFTQEIRLQSDSPESALQWVVGAVYQNSRLYTNQYVVDSELPELSLNVYGGSIEDEFGEGLVAGRYSYTVDQWARDQQSALFGQADYTFLDHFKATFGLRVARTTLDYHRTYDGPLFCPVCSGTVTGSTPAEKPVTPKVGLSYEPDSHNLVYFSAGKGSRVGGVNNPTPPSGAPGCTAGLKAPTTYGSDHLWSYEVGTKNDFADGRLRIQASAFYINWSDIQQSVSANGCFTTSYKDNLGRATIKGFDFAAEVRPIEHLSIELSGGYQDAKYATTAYTPPSDTGTRAIIANEGDTLPVAPWNASLSGEYDFPIAGTPMYFRADYTYTAKNTGHTTTQDPLTTTYDPDIPTDAAIRLLGARLGVRFNNIDVSIFGRNLLNDSPLLGVYHDGVGDPLFYAVTARPRTFGVTGTYRF